jgi:hypothetical protein
MKETLLQMADIIHLSPARQAQIYFTVQVNVPEKSLKLTTASSMFLERRSGIQPSRIVLAEATFHAGLAISCLEEWLKDQEIAYSIKEQFVAGHMVAKVTLK